MGGLWPREQCKVERPNKPAEGPLVVPLEGRWGWVDGLSGWAGVGWAGAMCSRLSRDANVRWKCSGPALSNSAKTHICTHKTNATEILSIILFHSECIMSLYTI
jgi:hypothetical protein